MYTYAFLQTPNLPLDLPQGIAGPLQLMSCDRLAALVEPDLSFEALQADDTQLVQAVLTHDHIICQLFQQTPLLPLRFGTRFVSEMGLLTHLEAHCQDYLVKLANVAQKAEYTLKFTPLVLSTETAVSAELQGRDYFLAKKRRFQNQLVQQEQQTVEWQTVVQAIAETYPHPVLGEAQDGSQRVYLLVPQPAESQLYEQLETWQAQCPHWVLSLSEALPPYHFV